MLTNLLRFLLLPIAFLALTASNAECHDQQFYELRIFRNSDPGKAAAVLKYVEQALQPALNRLGATTVGVFQPVESDKQPATGDVYVLIPFNSLTEFANLREQLQADDAYVTASQDFMSVRPKKPAYTRIESRLMKAFRGMPHLVAPSRSSPDRILELRTYESHTQDKARLKIEMFNEGEIDIMKDVKLAPVFFGESLVSHDLPNLTYMLSADNPEAHKQHFKDFLRHPQWDVIKRLPKYSGSVSNIISTMLKPAECSQI